MTFSADALKQQAAAMGFNLVGITPAVPSPTLDAYLRWVAAGMHGEMGYMARPDRITRRRDLSLILPGVKSLIVVGLDYHTNAVPETILKDPSRGRIATYAWGQDYHDVLTPRLEALAVWLRENANPSLTHRVYVDTGAILERSHAMAAGLGFTAKNTMLIHPRRGSFGFLGEILTNIAFDAYDQPMHTSMCGSCTRCLAACPTDAFAQPFVLDARRCISYLTIEYKGWIAPELRPLMGNWLFGCDDCQTVCPWNRFAPATREPAFYPNDPDRAAPPLSDLLLIDDAAFAQRFAGSPIERIKRKRLLRNACVAAGNSGDPKLIPALERLLHDNDPLLRGHAAWALHRLAGHAARPLLLTLQAEDQDAEVRLELDTLLAQ